MTSAPPPGRRRRRIGDQATAKGGGGSGTWRATPLVVILVAAGLLGWSTIRSADPTPAPPSTTELPMTRANLTCPAVGATDRPAAKAGIGMTSLPSKDAGEGNVEVRPLPKGDPLTSRNAIAPGEWTVLSQDSDASEPVLISAEGSMAAGATATVATDADERAGGGLAVADCARPAREAWFVGAGSTVDHASTLLISNPSDTDAVVDVSLLTKDGDVAPDNTSGLVLTSHEVERLDLAEFAADQGEAVVRVEATQGQVAAAVLDHWTATLTPAGTEWIPSAQPPAESATLSPLVEGAGRQELVIGNPGDRTADVDIQVIGPDGTHPVQDFEDASVSEGGVEVVRVPDAVADDTAALRLDADQPIVASVRSISSGEPVDVAYATAVPEVADPAVVPVDLPGVDPAGISLVVSSSDPASETSLTIEAYAADGSAVTESSVTVPAGATVTWQAGRRRDLDVDPDRVAYLVVTPGSGSLRGGIGYVSSDSDWASMPLTSAPSVVVAPGVYPLE